jgi:hypothetical protein
MTRPDGFPTEQLGGHANHWRRHGWVLMHDLIPASTATAALKELRAVSPEQLAESHRPAMRLGSIHRAEVAQDSQPRFNDRQFDGLTLFPYPASPTLNRLFVHPSLIRFAATVLATDDLRVYQARVWSKHGGHTDYDQPLHRDRNHSLIPVVNGAPWGHVEYFIFLHDVDETNGAPMVVPDSATTSPMSPPFRSTADRTPSSPIIDRDSETTPPVSSEVRASCRAGSVLAYRSDVWHRGRNLGPQQERHILAVSYRPTEAEWIGYDATGPRAGLPEFRHFVAGSTPSELALFGIPLPGHPVWTDSLLDAFGAMYPGLDLGPWRQATPIGLT